MPKRSLFEQFDDAVQAMLAEPDTRPLKVSKSLAPLLRVADDLRDLPREEFRARLKADLRRGNMSTTLELPITEYAATPYLAYRDASAAIAFYKKAFGAEERMRLTEPGGKIGHAEIAIGDSVIRLSDEYADYGVLSAQTLGGSPVRMNLHVPDVDAVAKQAVAAGAKMVRPVADQFYGYRSGVFSDPFGYTWILSTLVENVSAEEMQRRFDEMNRPSAVEPAPRVRPVPEGYHTITPYLVAQNAPVLLDFVKQVFDAKENYRSTGSAGGMHADVALGDSRMMIGGGGAGYSWKGDSKPGAFHVYVRDCDATYQRAVQAGATTILRPTDQDYGERSASVKDSEGNYWYIATFKGKDYKWEGAPDVQPSLHPLRAEPVLNFVKRAFAAEELGRYASPDGVIHHVTVKIGDSYMEMGEAHGPYQPMQSMFYLYVPNVDTLYQRALQAGAGSISEPADQPYGDRNAAVRDPFGNEWYIATHVKDVPME